MLEKIGYGTYIIFGLLTFLGAGFIWFFVPETKRLTLEEMVRFLSSIYLHNQSKCVLGCSYALTELLGCHLRIGRYCAGGLRAHGRDQPRDWLDCLDSGARGRQQPGCHRDREGSRYREERGYLIWPIGLRTAFGKVSNRQFLEEVDG